MKKIVCFITLLCTIFSLTTVTSFAWLSRGDRYKESSDAKKTLSGFVDKGLPAPIVEDPVAKAVDGRINIKLDGEFAYFYEKPVLTDGRVLLPFREMFEFFDMDVIWDDETKTATAKDDKIEIKITINSTVAYVNGEETNLDVGATIMNGRTYVPLRFVAESLGYSVVWDNRNQIVNIYTKGGGK